MRTKKCGLQIFVLCVATVALLALALVPSIKALATAKSESLPDIAGANSEQENAINSWVEETFKNVKAVNVVVCLEGEGWAPEWLNADAIAQDAISYIKSGAHNITYAPGADKEPKRQGCAYGPYLDEPGNLNFITVGTVGTSAPVRGHLITTASILRTIYRPDHRTSVSGFLRPPLLLNLSAQGAREEYEKSYRDKWYVGVSSQIEYNKP
jgi:hypothetical protein